LCQAPLNALLNSSEEEYTDEEQAAFTEYWKKKCDAHINNAMLHEQR